jgi:type II secretory pathway component PulF
MPNYSYKAINESGVSVSGVIETDSVESAKSALSGRGLIPSKVIAQSSTSSTTSVASFMDRLIPIKTTELILFTKQFRTMLRAGVPMMVLLSTLENQTEDLHLKRIVTSITQDVSSGSSLHNAFRKYPRTFTPLYCSMVLAGEASGALPEVMSRLIYIMEHEHKLKSEIRSAMQYPLIVLSFLTVAFFVMLTFVIPKFATIFERSGIELPILTRICMIIYTFFLHYWVIMLAALAIGIGFLSYYLKTEQGRLVRDRLLLALPIIGPLFIKAAMSRFASIFSILQASGVAVLESMTILSSTINNAAISQEFAQITDRLEEGRGISGPLRQARYFTPIVINMTAIGEESGNIEMMLDDIASHYDDELEYAMKRLSDAIGPILTVGLAVVVGFFALAIYIPMWDLTKMAR